MLQKKNEEGLTILMVTHGNTKLFCGVNRHFKADEGGIDVYKRQQEKKEWSFYRQLCGIISGKPELYLLRSRCFCSAFQHSWESFSMREVMLLICLEITRCV